MATWLGVYKAMTPGVNAADNSTTSLDTDNDPQPDLSLYILPETGGRVRMDKQGYIIGSPELIVEMAASSRSWQSNVRLIASASWQYTVSPRK